VLSLILKGDLLGDRETKFAEKDDHSSLFEWKIWKILDADIREIA